jgi:hypothetical protein
MEENMIRLVKIYTEERNDKIAVWAQMDDETPYNIWDLPKQHATEDVIKAIESAFERGCLFTRQSIEDIRLHTTLSTIKHQPKRKNRKGN